MISIDSELVLMLALFFSGILAGSMTKMRDEIPPLSKLIPNGIFCGLFGIIGGSLPNLFLASQNHIVTISSGIVFSCSIALFSNEEIKTFLTKIIKHSIAKIFNWKLNKE